MADIQAIRNAIDEHLDLHVAMLGAKADAEAVGIATSEKIEKAKSAFEVANSKAQRAFNTSVKTAGVKRDKVVASEEEQLVSAQAMATDAEAACDVYRVKVKEDLNIDLPDYGRATSGGHTRL